MREDFPTRDDLVAYLRGRLTPEEEAGLESRLAGDEALRQELERTRTVLEIVDAANEESVVRWVNGCLNRAVESNASDIHLDLTRDGGVVRLRVDGVLHEIERLPTEVARATIGRFKQLCDLAPADFQTPAEGRFDLSLGSCHYVVFGSFVPGVNGGRMCLRLVDRQVALVQWDKVFIRPENDAAAQRFVRQPNGLVLVTGPAGSGKTTVLYTMVNRVAGESVNVLSVENPVELDLPWVAQTGINPKAGYGWAEVLKSFMRQDPDVIMIGDIADLDTAMMAIEAASTGHLILANMATLDGLSTLGRLRDLGVAPFHLASVLVGAVSMRLVRRICDHCRTEKAVTGKSLLLALGLDERTETVQAGQGCDHCRGTGYRGRAPLMELIEASEPFRDAIARDAPPEVLRDLAFTPELPSFRGQAAWLIEQGITTPEEAYRVLYRVL